MDDLRERLAIWLFCYRTYYRPHVWLKTDEATREHFRADASRLIQTDLSALLPNPLPQAGEHLPGEPLRPASGSASS